MTYAVDIPGAGFAPPASGRAALPTPAWTRALKLFSMCCPAVVIVSGEGQA